MKLTSLGIIFIIIISPFLFISSQKSNATIQDQRLRYYYDNIIDNAVQDAAHILSENLEDTSYSNNIVLGQGKKIAAQTFFDSVYYAFDSNKNPVSMARVDACIPVIVFLENDCFSIYSLTPYKNANNEYEVKHCWSPLQYYIGESIEDRYIIRYTLDDKIYIYDTVEKVDYEGDYMDYSHIIPLLNDAQSFENLRLSAVKNSVQLKLKDYINRYNQWATSRSLCVNLHLPAINDSDWIRALADEGLLVFAQGFPTLQGKKYEHYALGGGRVIRKPTIIGYKYNDMLNYCNQHCEYYINTVLPDPLFDQDSVLYFSNAYNAANEGYFPCPHCSAR